MARKKRAPFPPLTKKEERDLVRLRRLWATQRATITQIHRVMDLQRKRRLAEAA
jgi:hypothetical protein